MVNQTFDESGQTNDQNASLQKFVRYAENPIITPAVGLDWQARATFNPTALYENETVHIIYRAQSKDGTSVFGYASSKDGLHINENLADPIYQPRENFEIKTSPEGSSGCEDPRITKIGDRLYMTYTAFDGTNPPRIALTSIALQDFLQKTWDWQTPQLISPPEVDDRDSCIIVKRVRSEGYVAFHRLGEEGIWVDFLKDLEFSEKKYLSGSIMARARRDKWDNVKIGIAAPPLETEHGWILIYHAVCDPGYVYKIGAMLLDYDDPRTILARTEEPLLEPEQSDEKAGQVSNIIFACGAVVIDGVVYLYYGESDSVVCVATMPLDALINTLLKK